jgi:hypothetical protein
MASEIRCRERERGNGPSIKVVRHQRAAAAYNLVYFGAFCWAQGNTDTRRAGTEPPLYGRRVASPADALALLLSRLLDDRLSQKKSKRKEKSKFSNL